MPQVGLGLSDPGPTWGLGPGGTLAQVGPGRKWAKTEVGPRAQVVRGPEPGPQVGQGRMRRYEHSPNDGSN